MNAVGDAIVRIGPALAVAVALLAVIAVTVNRVGRTGYGQESAVAIVRAAVQLSALAVVLGVVMQRFWTSVIFVGVMACAAAWTSAGRVGGHHSTWTASLRCLLPVAVPTGLVVTALVLTEVLPATGLAVIPTAGIMFAGR